MGLQAGTDQELGDNTSDPGVGLRLRERAARRPDFRDDGVPIRLLDGQDWHFPRTDRGPIVPVVRDGRCVFVAQESGLGEDFDQALDFLDRTTIEALDVAAEIEAGGDARPVPLAESAEACFHVAIAMLRRNYVIPDHYWPKILGISFAHDAYTAMWNRIIGLARGNEPESEPESRPADDGD